jgi:arylsulfatase A-like enzyme
LTSNHADLGAPGQGAVFGLSPVAAALSAVALMAAAGCARQAAEPAPRPTNLILVTFDACRADHVSTYGYARNTTPNIDAFAEKAVVFERAFSQAASTAPALSSLMTSKYVHHHGVLETYEYALSADEQTMAEHMKAAGFTTAAFVGIGVLMPSRQLDQGFDTYVFTEYSNNAYWKIAPRITDEVLHWLDERSEGPFFLWVHYFEPHQPYKVVPEEYRTRFAGAPMVHPALASRNLNEEQKESTRIRVNAYDGALNFADEHFGRLMARVADEGLLESTAIFLSADHGELLGEHGHHSHTYTLYEPIVRVPLMVYAPGIQPGRVGSLVEHVDLLPTILTMFGLEAGDEMDGRLLPLGGPSFPDADSSADARKFAFSETWMADRRVGMAHDGRWKYVLYRFKDGSEREQLFDIDNDRDERINQAATNPEHMATLETALLEWMSDRIEEPERIGQKPGETEMLRVLGYID